MKAFRYLLLAICLAVSGAATAEAQSAGIRFNDADRLFLRQAAQRAAFRARLGELAGVRTNSSAIQQLGRRLSRVSLVDALRVATLATGLGISVVPEPTAGQIEQLLVLTALSNAQFNRTFLNLQLAGIRSEIHSSRRVIGQGNNLAVRAFARQRLLTLNNDLVAAQRLRVSRR